MTQALSVKRGGYKYFVDLGVAIDNPARLGTLVAKILEDERVYAVTLEASKMDLETEQFQTGPSRALAVPSFCLVITAAHGPFGGDDISQYIFDCIRSDFME